MTRQNVQTVVRVRFQSSRASNVQYEKVITITGWLVEICLEESPTNKGTSFRVKTQKGLCDNCLQSGHMVKACPREKSCQLPSCELKHRKQSILFHPKRQQCERSEPQLDPFPSGTGSEAPNVQANDRFVGVTEKLCSSMGTRSSFEGLGEVPIKVRAKGKRTIVESWALLDPGCSW